MCEVLTILRISYYNSSKKPVSDHEQENQELIKEIYQISLKSKVCYGASKIHKILINNESYLSLKRVQRLTKKAGICSVTKKNTVPIRQKKRLYS
ncbi:IS3 family transposase [Priestia megaterium]|uniref:IS3 family transposase n=1 Tax=Priestia megaterium TaxID=1404 RepID=UPI00366E5ADB